MNPIPDIRERLLGLLLITLTEFSAVQLMPYVPRDDFYYVVCGAFNLVTLAALQSIGSASVTVDLAKLTFAQLCIQAIGWVLYSRYLSPDFYNVSIHAIVAATYARILIKGRDDGAEDDFDRSIFHRHAIKRGGAGSEVHQ